MMDALARLVRDDRRRRLRNALRGEDGDRWEYALGRVLAPAQGQLLAYGRAEFDARIAAHNAVRNYHRLTRLAERWAQPKE